VRTGGSGVGAAVPGVEQRLTHFGFSGDFQVVGEEEEEVGWVIL